MNGSDVDVVRGNAGAVGIATAIDPDTRVSVVMPAYNAAKTLAASMQSVLTQTWRGVELLVIDDRSSDATWEMIETAAAQDPRVVPIRMPRNGGVAAARNAGIEAATGERIAFLDSDDRWFPDKLALQLAHMQATGTQVSYAGYQRFNENGCVLSIVHPPAEVGYRDMLRSNHIGNLTGMYDRALGDMRFQRVGHEDYVFWLQLVRTAGVARRVPHPGPLAEYLVRGGSLSSNKLRAARWQWNIYRDIEKLGLASSAWYFLHYAVHAVAKRR